MFEDAKRRFRSFTNFINPRSQPNVPSYGKGLAGLAKRAVDVVSPNTAQDVARRQAAGQAASFAQQQAQKAAAAARVQALKPTQRVTSFTAQPTTGPKPLSQAQPYRPISVAQQYNKQPIQTSKTNPVGDFIYNLTTKPRQALNLAVQGVGAVKDLEKITSESIFGTDQSYQQAVNEAAARQKSGLQGPGIFKSGVLKFAKDPGFSKGPLTKQAYKEIFQTGTDIAQYIPVAGGIQKGISLGAQLPKVIARNATEGAITSGLARFGSQLGENKPINKKEILTDTALGGLISGAAPILGAAFSKKPLSKDVINSLKETKSAPGIIRIAQKEGLGLSDQEIENLAKATTTKEVEKTVTGVLDREASKIAQAAKNQAAQVPLPGATTAASKQFNDNLVTGLQRTTSPQQTQDVVRALFGDIPTAEQSRIATELANTKDAAAIRKTLEDAQTRRTAVTESIEQATPTAPVRQADVIEQAAEAPAIAAPTPTGGLPEAQIAEVPAAQPGIMGRFRELMANETGGARLRGEAPVSPEVEQLRATRQRLQQQWDQASIQTRPSIEDAIRRNDLEIRSQQAIDSTQQAGATGRTVSGEETGGARIEDIPFLRRFARGAEEVTPQTQVAGAAQEGLQRTSGSLPPSIPEAGETLLEQSQRSGLTPSEILFGTRTPSPEQKLNFIQQYSPQRFLRENVTRPIVDQLNAIIGKAQLSDIGVIRGLGRLPVGLTKEAGMTPELLAASRKFLTGTTELGKITAEDIVKIGKELDKSAVNRVWATLDPERAAELGIDVNKVNLTAPEQALRSKMVQLKDSFTEGNVSRNILSQEQADAEWFKRSYAIFDFASTEDKFYKQTMQQMFGQTKIKKQFAGRKTVSDEIKQTAIQDAPYLMAKKSAESHAAWGIYDYTDFLNKNGFVSDVQRPGYVQLPSNKLYGESAGKYVPRNAAEEITGFQSGYAVLNSINDALNWYDKNPLRQGKKMLLTVLNPAVRGGNRVSNEIFAQLNGINPVTFNKNLAQVGKLEKSRAPIYIEAVQQGLVGNNLMSGDFGRKIAEYTGDPNGIKKALDWAKKSYSKADDDAKVAAFKSHVDRGYSYDNAAQLVRRGFQDSKSVGYFYDTAAKIPLVGNAFVRFAGDASRILTNAVIDNPLTVAGTIATIATLGNVLSKVSGETADDKKTREGRFGAPTIPFTDISLEFQTPYGAVNVARFLPFYELNDVGNPVTRFLPFSGNPTNPKNWSDPLLGSVGQLITDKDFRGKSIKDPENTGQFLDKLSGRQELINRAKFAIPQNIPLGREATAIYQASTGQADIYGKERSLPQSLLRAGGIKVEQFGKGEAEKLRNQQRFQEDKKRIEEVAATLPKGAQEAYKQLTGYYKLRDKKANEYAPGTERFVKAPVYNFSEDKYREIAKDPRVYDLLLQKKIQDNQRDKTPIAPEFDTRLSNEFRRQLIANKAIAPGDDAETDAKIRTSSEWDTYTQLKDQYGKDLKTKYGTADKKFVDELVKNPDKEYPKKGAYKAAYDEAYKLYATGRGAKPAFTDAVAADKDAYEENMRNWTNDARKTRGLGPIAKEVWDNVSFGFQSDEEKIYKELKYGKGFGGFGFGFGGGGGPKDQRQYLSTLLSGGLQLAETPQIKTTPTRFKLKVQKPTKGRKARIRLG